MGLFSFMGAWNDYLGPLIYLSNESKFTLSLGLASEVEVVSPEGRVVFSRPNVAPVVHVPGPEERRLLDLGRSVTAVARDCTSLRVLSYLPIPGSGAGELLRLSSPAPDLEDEAREWQQVLLGHVAALAALALAAVLVLLPRGGEAAPASGGALEAYEEAMGRLRDSGEGRPRFIGRHQAGELARAPQGLAACNRARRDVLALLSQHPRGRAVTNAYTARHRSREPRRRARPRRARQERCL